MSDRPITNIHDLVKKEVTSHIEPFVQVTMMEHEQTRKKLDDLEKTVCTINKINIHDILQYAGIILLAFLLLTLA